MSRDMTITIWFVVICILIFLYFRRKSQKKYERLQLKRSFENKYQYFYNFDNGFFALDVRDKKFLFHCSDNTKEMPLSKIREWSIVEFPVYNRMGFVIGYDFRIEITLADIENPGFFIVCGNKGNALKLSELIRQAVNNELEDRNTPYNIN